MISGSNDGKEAEKDVITPPIKKLKQARLSFQKLSPSVDTSPKNVKKRKISEDSGDEIKVVKLVKPNSEKSLPLTQEKNHDSEASNCKKIEKKCPSECEIEVVDLESEVDRNEQEDSQGNVKLDTTDKDIEKKSTDNKSEDEKKSNTNIKNAGCENENEKPKITSKDFSPKTTTNEKPILNNEIELDNDSDSSESESDESSEGDNELNETIEDQNSSDSCGEVTKADDLCQNTSRNNIETESKVPLTPKNNIHRSDIIKKKKLTPKQLLQREEAAKKKEEKEKQRKEKERRKAEAKEKKRKEKKEKEELKRKEKEEKEEQRRKEKEEKEKKKLAELEQKSEEKRLKEEERRKKEEQRVLEKRKKDEKKFAEEEAKRKEEEVKKKEAAAFANFFVAPKGASKITEEVKVNNAENFMPFQVKADMRLAPLCRSNFDGTRMESFDTHFKEQSSKELYFDHLRKNSYVRGKCGKTWPLSDLRDVIIIDDEDDDVILASSSNEVVESHPTLTHPKAKLLMFCENRRPPYWGTWTKKSKSIRPTCPFRKDEGFFDYEVDSDDEWEEEEPGESLHGSDDEKESEDEYEVDNEFFVPHGYLSDEENCEEEVMNPETMKAKLKFLEMEFEEEMKHKTERIKPRLFGCFWASQKSDEVGARVLALLSSYRAVSQENPIVLSGPSTPEVGSPVHESQGTCPSTGSKKRKKKFPEAFVPALIKLVHGNINGRGFLVKEISSYMRKELETARLEKEKDNDDQIQTDTVVSKVKISEKIKEIASWIACPDEGPFLNRMCWYVTSEIRAAYGLEDLVIPNKVWNYINVPKRELELSNTIPSPVVSEANFKPKSLPLITKFTRKLSPEERQRQLALSNSSSETEIDIVDEVKVVSTSEDNEKITGGDKSNKENSSVNDGKIIAVNVTSGKTDLDTPNSGLKKMDSFGIRGKLLQFKSKGASIIPHLEQQKRVPILKSVPLGQAFSPSTSNSSSTGAQEKQTNGKNDIKETSEDVDCIVID
ncbi:hypothetical protein R5R35_005003 [Gryllus longicercus]|uniref:Chromatin assembly factor 1 subunit A n=1 Tax=Gryllus longicercus TaxID=2509291 RepID=A0AAN9VXH3_9ORTH